METEAAVQARWLSRGEFQAMALETKRTGGTVYSGDIVMLKSLKTQRYLDVEGPTAKARYTTTGLWQELVVTKAAGGEGPINPNDALCFQSVHTQRYLDVQTGRGETTAVQARESTCGFAQKMVIEREDANALFAGDSVYLLSSAGMHVDVEASDVPVQARWQDQGSWQHLKIENFGGRAIWSGDTIFLTSMHTSTMLDVENGAVRARWSHWGGWRQSLVIRKSGGGIIFPGDSIYLIAKSSGKALRVENEIVLASSPDSIDSFVIERPSRRLADALSADGGNMVELGSFVGLAVGLLVGLGFMGALALITVKRPMGALRFLGSPLLSRHASISRQGSNKVHPSTECSDDEDDDVCGDAALIVVD